MSRFAYLPPVGPFAGLSNAARHKIGERFPYLFITEIESAIAAFLDELQISTIGPRLLEARDELNIFAKELARFHSGLNRIRKHRLDRAIAEASRLICGEDELERMERCFSNLRRAILQTSAALPLNRAELASRRLIATLAEQAKQSALSPSAGSIQWLVDLIDLIFEELMIGADAASAVTDWRKRQASDTDLRATDLADLVVF